MMTVATLVATVMVGACVQPEDDAKPVGPQTVDFQGKPDPKFVGTWKTADARSGLDLAQDGKLTVHVVTASPQGDHSFDLMGDWLVNSDGDLMLQYLDASKSVTKLKYKTKLEGGKLTLAQPNGLKTIYLRSPEAKSTSKQTTDATNKGTKA